MKINTIQKYWFIIILLLVETSLSFLDRQVLSLSIIRIKEDLHVTDVQYGFINAGFLVSYALMFTLGGILIDRFGSRIGLAVSVGFWSMATMLHSVSSNVFHFGFFRFLLGLGEGGAFPGAVKAVMEWVPKNKRAFANGIAIGGSAFGAVIAPPLCAYFLGVSTWRVLFLISGGVGFLWLVLWWMATRKRKTAPDIRVHKATEEPVLKEPVQKVKISRLLKDREVLVFVVIRFLLDPIFYFYMFWIPKYLNEIHSLSLDIIGKVLWIPFFALGIANIFGGWISDYIFRITGNLDRSRKMVMGIAALLTLPVLFTGYLKSYVVILFIMSLAFFAHGLWITNYITSISDIFGKNSSSTIVGLSGSAGAISSLVLNPLIGLVVTAFSYNPMWFYAGLMYPVAFIIMVRFIPRIRLKEFAGIPETEHNL